MKEGHICFTGNIKFCNRPVVTSACGSILDIPFI